MPYGNRKEKFFKECPICKEIFKIAFWELKTKKTCSFNCSKEFKKTIPIKQETIDKIQKKKKGRFFKENSSRWKGDKASYESQHEWIRKEYIRVHGKLPTRCQNCNHKKKRLEASNISGKYLRTLSDYQWFCKQCHNAYDEKDKEYFRRLPILSKKN